MVSNRKRRRHVLTLAQLESRAHSDQDAHRALLRYEELSKAGKEPEIYFSGFNGYTVRDPDDDRLREW